MKQKKGTFTWVMEFAGQKRRDYILSAGYAILGALCQILPFVVTAHIVQKLLGGDLNFHGYLKDCLVIAGIWAVRVVFHAISTSKSHVATFAVLANIRRQGLEKLARMPLGDVQSMGSGNLKNILVERVDSIETTLAHMIPEMSGNLCAVAATLGLLFYIDWRMALVSLITFPVGMACFLCMMIGYEKDYSRTVRATKHLNDTAVEYIGGIEVIKVFGKAKSSYEKFVDAAREGAASYVDWMRKSNLYFTFAMNIMPATLVTVLPIGGLWVKNGSLSVLDLIVVILLAMGMIVPVINCMSFSDGIAKLGTIMGEITAILDAEEMSRPQTQQTLLHDHTLALDKVHFGYGESEVLHGIDLTFQEGTVNALVGPSGSGKSTIAKLIASFWDVQAGGIYIGGVDIRELAPKQYYGLIAYVSQENFLFDDTIRENIRMGRRTATDAEVEQAAKDCGCWEFIMGLEHGFDTIAGSGGSHLSGGERQRICIARAMLKNAPIVILDEATAYTDPENEAIIQASVAKLVQGKTLIVIAHRLSTIVHADQITVIEQGRIAGNGTHEALLASCPLYQKLWAAHTSARDSL